MWQLTGRTTPLTMARHVYVSPSTAMVLRKPPGDVDADGQHRIR